MQYGLVEVDIQKIHEAFASQSESTRAVLWLTAKGNYKLCFDIELMLKGSDLNLTVLGNIESDLDYLLLPYKIDLSILGKRSNNELTDRVGKIFYERKKNNEQTGGFRLTTLEKKDRLTL
jgi:hypothetical protein